MTAADAKILDENISKLLASGKKEDELVQDPLFFDG